VTNFGSSQPGGTQPSAWPQCVFQNKGQNPGPITLDPVTHRVQITPQFNAAMQTVFNNHSSNGCGNAQGSFGFTSALVTQPQTLIRHFAANGDGYMYTGPVGGTVDQFKLTIDPISGFTTYQFRTYLTGVSLTTGLGVADDLKSLMVYTDPSTVGAAGQEVVTRLPICEDM
jgi:hypothetical protein